MVLSDLFPTLLDMSFTASLVILAVCVLRLLLKRAPKLFSYGLWLVVLFRLLCPVSFETAVSILPHRPGHCCASRDNPVCSHSPCRGSTPPADGAIQI